MPEIKESHIQINVKFPKTLLFTCYSYCSMIVTVVRLLLPYILLISVACYMILTPCAGILEQTYWHQKKILLDGPVSWNLKRSFLISSSGRTNAPLLSPVTAPLHERRQTRNAVSDFDGFLPAKFSKGKHLHLRPIENYWAALKQTMYTGGYQNKSIDSLQQQIYAKIFKIGQQFIINISTRSNPQ